MHLLARLFGLSGNFYFACLFQACFPLPCCPFELPVTPVTPLEHEYRCVLRIIILNAIHLEWLHPQFDCDFVPCGSLRHNIFRSLFIFMSTRVVNTVEAFHKPGGAIMGCCWRARCLCRPLPKRTLDL